eukprot:TRINITY_DN26996_c0_g1_i1.p1 TRINITY_DN26996_c0_g1~~TRINITY_DN26996_c0_g1_i1.p1  ORF type:complete len:550 (+),score=134.64 TRINITY_DN26996_c0_g1_i1:85-1734(+)
MLHKFAAGIAFLATCESIRQNAHGDLDASVVGEMEQDSSGELSADPNYFANKYVTRQCILYYARKFEDLRTALNLPKLTRTKSEWNSFSSRPLDLSGDNGQTLVEALEKRWELSDQMKASKERLSDQVKTPDNAKPLKEELGRAKDAIKARGFSVSKVKGYCQETVNDAPEYDLMSCMKEIARGEKDQAVTLKALKKVGLEPRKEAWQPNSRAKSDVDDLQKQIDVRVTLETEITMLEKMVIPMEPLAGKVKTELKSLKRKLDVSKAAIKAYGYSFYHNRKMCAAELRKTTPSHSILLLKRSLAELNEPVKKKGKCEEKQDMYCPEGMSVQAHRGFDSVRAAYIFATAPVWGNGIGTATGAVVGCIAGTAALGMGCFPAAGMGVAAALSIPIEWPMAAVVAPLASVDIFPKCRCYPDACAYDDATDSCTMQAHKDNKKGGKNPYRWLPYPGQKCAQKPATSKAEKKCAIQACQPQDFKNTISGVPGLFGTLGKQDGFSADFGAVHNCLSLDGSAENQLQGKLEDEVADLGMVNNTARDRAILYDRIMQK